jgi:hypothetical protein
MAIAAAQTPAGRRSGSKSTTTRSRNSRSRSGARSAPATAAATGAGQGTGTFEQAVEEVFKAIELLPPEMRVDLLSRFPSAAIEGVRRGIVAGGGRLGAVTASPSDVTDEMDKGGPAFGSFVKAVGLAVADAQSKLDADLVETAKALSETTIDVIAVFEEQIDNDGNMTAGVPHVEKLPLINYLMPTAYAWSRVYLQADMQVSEFNAANGFNIQGRSSSFSAGASVGYGIIGGFGASGSTRYSSSSFQYGGESSVSVDTAAGQLHMEATLEPRPDIQLPKPLILQKGPRLKVTAGARSDIMGTATPPVAIGRKMTLSVELFDQANNALAAKEIAFKISEPLLNYSVAPSNGQTDSNGQLTIELRREGAAFDATKPPENVFVNVWLGLVHEQVSVSI